MNVEDFDEPAAICQMCERKEIRYVHYMEHPTYPETLGCGCACAGRMAEDYEGARQRETLLRNAASRKNKWLSRKWRTSVKGNDFLNTSDGYNVVVFGGAQSWSYFVKNRKTNEACKPRRPFTSSDAAKLAAFDTMVWMKGSGH